MNVPTPASLRPATADLFPPEQIPYLIVAPKYNPKSAGVRVLHALCHTLNMTGQRAYLMIFPQLVMDSVRGLHTCPDLCTPLITPGILSTFEEQGRAPIVVYPETIKNPTKATRIARYVLNYPGLLGGDKTYPASETPFTYSKRIAAFMGLQDDRVMFMPASDPNIFYPPPEGSTRRGSCFYASKYLHFHKGELLPDTADSFEITANKPDSLTKPQIADLFRRSEVFYTYEDTALAIEAALCGCPTVFLPNLFLKDPLGFDDLGMDGFAWGNTPDELARAKATVHRFRDNYEAVAARFHEQLKHFITVTQQQARENPSPSRLQLPTPNLFTTIYYLYAFIKQYGFKRFCLKTFQFIQRFGLVGIAQNTLKNSFGRR